MSAEALKKSARTESTVHAFQKIPFIANDPVEDGLRLARRAVRHGRYAAEDAIEEAEHLIKQRPFQTIGLGFAAGVLAGGFLSWFAARRR